MVEQLQYGVHQNPHLHLEKDVLDGMTRRWETHLEQMRKTSALIRLEEPTPDERELRRRLRESQLRLAGVDDALVSRIREQRTHRARQMVSELANLGVPYQAPRLFPDQPPTTDAPSGIGELWWAKTNWSWNDPGLTPFWDDSAGLRFAGDIGDLFDIYMRRHITAVAQFSLSADRIPPDLLGTVVSAPRANVFGAVQGLAFASLLDFGDQWCKCWLNLRQTVSVKNLFIGFDSGSIGTSSSVIELIYIDGDGFASNFFPGPIQMPVVQFGLNAGWSIEVDLEFWFDIQLEGDNTNIIFGNTPEFQSNLIQTFQWNLTRA